MHKNTTDNLNYIRNGCEVCGTGARRYTHNAKGLFGYHACYQCYNDRINKLDSEQILESELFDIAIKQSTCDLEAMYTFHLKKRIFLRNERRKNFILDPETKCSCCGAVKSIFEFEDIGTRKHRNTQICYQCLHDKEFKEPCLACGDILYKDQLRENICIPCFQKIQKNKVDSTERYLSEVSLWQCESALKAREIPVNTENVQFIEQVILAKRIKKILRNEQKRRGYESSYSDVYGKQQPYEENNEGRI